MVTWAKGCDLIRALAISIAEVVKWIGIVFYREANLASGRRPRATHKNFLQFACEKQNYVLHFS